MDLITTLNAKNNSHIALVSICAIDIEDLNGLISILKKREESYIQILDFSLKYKGNNVLEIEQGAILYQNMYEFERQRLKKEDNIVEKYISFKAIENKDKKLITKLINKIIQLNTSVKDKLIELEIYEESKDMIKSNIYFEDTIKLLIQKNIIDVEMILNIIIKNYRTKFQKEIQKLKQLCVNTGNTGNSANTGSSGNTGNIGNPANAGNTGANSEGAMMNYEGKRGGDGQEEGNNSDNNNENNGCSVTNRMSNQAAGSSSNGGDESNVKYNKNNEMQPSHKSSTNVTHNSTISGDISDSNTTNLNKSSHIEKIIINNTRANSLKTAKSPLANLYTKDNDNSIGSSTSACASGGGNGTSTSGVIPFNSNNNSNNIQPNFTKGQSINLPSINKENHLKSLKNIESIQQAYEPYDKSKPFSKANYLPPTVNNVVFNFPTPTTNITAVLISTNQILTSNTNGDNWKAYDIMKIDIKPIVMPTKQEFRKLLFDRMFNELFSNNSDAKRSINKYTQDHKTFTERTKSKSIMINFEKRKSAQFYGTLDSQVLPRIDDNTSTDKITKKGLKPPNANASTNTSTNNPNNPNSKPNGVPTPLIGKSVKLEGGLPSCCIQKDVSPLRLKPNIGGNSSNNSSSGGNGGNNAKGKNEQKVMIISKLNIADETVLPQKEQGVNGGGGGSNIMKTPYGISNKTQQQQQLQQSAYRSRLIIPDNTTSTNTNSTTTPTTMTNTNNLDSTNLKNEQLIIDMKHQQQGTNISNSTLLDDDNRNYHHHNHHHHQLLLVHHHPHHHHYHHYHNQLEANGNTLAVTTGVGAGGGSGGDDIVDVKKKPQDNWNLPVIVSEKKNQKFHVYKSLESPRFQVGSAFHNY